MDLKICSDCGNHINKYAKPNAGYWKIGKATYCKMCWESFISLKERTANPLFIPVVA